MELTKVGYCYASLNKIKSILKLEEHIVHLNPHAKTMNM